MVIVLYTVTIYSLKKAGIIFTFYLLCFKEREKRDGYEEFPFLFLSYFPKTNLNSKKLSKVLNRIFVVQNCGIVILEKMEVL